MVPYWEPNLINHHDLPIADSIKKLRNLFFEAVKIRLRSDVPVGVLLSGGIDSSSIASAVQYLNGADGDLNLLSAVSNDSKFDESPFINKVSAYLNRPVTKIVTDLHAKTAIHKLEEATWFNDQPLISFSNVAHYLLMQKARERGITVMLSGQGADELLCGYRKYLGFYILSLVRLGQIKEAQTTIYQFWRNNTVLNQFSFSEAKRYLPQWMCKTELNHRGENLSNFEPLAVGLSGGMSIQQRQWLDLQKFSVPALTHYEDRMSMASSREIRLPFLDVRLIEFLLPLAANLKLRYGWTKYIFRKAMEEYLPAEIIWRKDKQGFINPQSEWLKNELRAEILAYFSTKSRIFKFGLVNRSILLKKYYAFCRQRPGRGKIWFKEIFNPLALEIWLRKYETWIADI